MTRSSEPTTAASQPLATAPLLGGAPLIRGENVRSYDELLERICATLQPRDSLEEIWIREIVDLTGGSSFELCKILYQFLNSRLVRRRAA